jgi:hypothetical protein
VLRGTRRKKRVLPSEEQQERKEKFWMKQNSGGKILEEKFWRKNSGRFRFTGLNS